MNQIKEVFVQCLSKVHFVCSFSFFYSLNNLEVKYYEQQIWPKGISSVSPFNVHSGLMFPKLWIFLPKVLSSILLYMMADDFLCTILCVIAWYFLLNSFSLWVDSIDADLLSVIVLPTSERNISMSCHYYLISHPTYR